MAQKSTRIMDVKSPGKVAPEASSRPILVTNRPVLASDPMVVAGDSDGRSTDVAGPPVVTGRSAKVIRPIRAEAADEADETKEPAVPEPETEAEAPAESPVAAKTEAPAPALVRATGSGKPETRDAEAEASAAETEAETARLVRLQELEQLIASGQYAVPIDAVQRKRSRTFVFLMCLLALVLAVVLLDVLLDTGIVKLPAGIPHTHIFSGA
jgi:anti-sigma28 factor (negative regulator of flagellin synthesis)